MAKPSIDNIKRRFAAYEQAVSECDAAEAAWVNDPESAELETAFDAAYSKQGKTFNSLVGAVVGFTDGKLARNDVRRLVAFNHDEFAELIARAA